MEHFPCNLVLAGMKLNILVFVIVTVQMELILIFINYNETKSAFLNKIVESVLFESICKKWQFENRKK